MAKERLTPAEWEVMTAIWSLGGAPSVRDVLEKAFPNGEKAYTTVQTVMNTLEKKGMLDRKKIGLVNFYRPVHDREAMAREEIDSMVTRVFGGSIHAVANSLLSLDGLDRKEIEAIKKLLDRKERELEEEES